MDEILVNTTTAGLQHQPAITWIDNTHFVVVWTDCRDGNIKGAMFDTAVEGGRG